MKYILNIAALLTLSILVSCTPWANTQPQEINDTNPSPEQNQQEVSQEETWSVVLELTNPAQLAGETLNFEVTIEKIEKAESNSESEIVENWDSIEVNYIGTLENGEEFDSSFTRNQTLPFTVGAGQMITGFREEIPTSEIRAFVWPDFEIAVGATIPTAGGEATIVEILD